MPVINPLLAKTSESHQLWHSVVTGAVQQIVFEREKL